MRKLSLILAVLLFTLTAPAWAAVNITCEQIGTSDDVLVSYEVVGEPNKVRAFALDITVDNGVISAVDANVADYDPNYGTYPGSIVIVDGEVNEPGTAVADPCDLPGDTLGGIGTSGITIEMGALYSPPDDANGPPLTGDLLIFTNTVVSGNTIVTITENDSRGGVVLTDPAADPNVNAPGCEIERGPGDCLVDEGDQEYTAWDAWGKPDCWCYPRQCRGDIDGLKQYGAYWVFTGDLNIFKDNFGQNPVSDICADLDHKVQYTVYRVFTNDLEILKTYFGQPQSLIPTCDQAPIITGPYNFWTSP